MPQVFQRRDASGFPLLRIRDSVHSYVASNKERMASKRKNWSKIQLTFGKRVADTIAAMMGSWSFIIVQTVILILWIALNVGAWVNNWDPYPFILLNLALSFQAAYTAPFIMISQNRQADRDRHQADEDFRTNVEAEQRIEELQKRLEAIEINKLDKIIALLEKDSSADPPSKIQPDGSAAPT